MAMAGARLLSPSFSLMPPPRRVSPLIPSHCTSASDPVLHTGSACSTFLDRKASLCATSMSRARRDGAEASAAVAADVLTQRHEPRSFGVLFVCLGNICRSPTAEAIFRFAVEKRGLESRFNIDSAGIIDYHEGEPADARMRTAAIKRGIKLTSTSRPILPTDFEDFDLILAMDNQNKEDILKAYDRWNKKQEFPPDVKQKIKLVCSYCKTHKETEVPDPYYGGPAGFEKVLDLLEDACESLLDSIVATYMKSAV